MTQEQIQYMRAFHDAAQNRRNQELRDSLAFYKRLQSEALKDMEIAKARLWAVTGAAR